MTNFTKDEIGRLTWCVKAGLLRYEQSELLKEANPHLEDHLWQLLEKLQRLAL